MIARALHTWIWLCLVHSGTFTELSPRLSLTLCFIIALSKFNNIINWNVEVLFCTPPVWFSLLIHIYFSSFELFCFVVCPCRLAKATLTLIPLFGIHEMIFIFATDEQTTGILRYIKVFFTLTLNSFQVGLIRVCCSLSNI